VGGELDAFLPAFVGEQDDAVVAFLLQREARVGADPFGGAGEEPPEHQLAWNELFQLHFHGADFLAVVGEADLDRAAGLAVAVGVFGPPGGDAFGGGQAWYTWLAGALMPTLCAISTIAGSSRWAAGAALEWTICR
jgi:hypothetical protein